MNPERVGAELAERTAYLKDVPAKSLDQMAKSVREVIAGVRGQAQRAGHNIDVRMVVRGQGVRVTVLGPHAARYRSLISKELTRRDLQAELRTMATSRKKR